MKEKKYKNKTLKKDEPVHLPMSFEDAIKLAATTSLKEKKSRKKKDEKKK